MKHRQHHVVGITVTVVSNNIAIVSLFVTMTKGYNLTQKCCNSTPLCVSSLVQSCHFSISMTIEFNFVLNLMWRLLWPVDKIYIGQVGFYCPVQRSQSSDKISVACYFSHEKLQKWKRILSNVNVPRYLPT